MTRNLISVSNTLANARVRGALCDIFESVDGRTFRKKIYGQGLYVDENHQLHKFNASFNDVPGRPLDVIEILNDDINSSKYKYFGHDISLRSSIFNSVSSIGKIDEEAFLEFSKNLHPIIVGNLGLDKSSKKIESYNYCLPGSIFSLDEESRNRVIRNRSKALGCFPLLQAIVKNDPEYGTQILSSIDEGVRLKSAETFKEYLGVPLVTLGFLRRISDIPYRLAKDFSGVIHQDYQDGKIGDRKYDAVISEIPLPSDAKQYEAMWKVLQLVNDCRFSKPTKSKIFLNVKKENWSQNYQIISKNFKYLSEQYLQMVVDDLMIPFYINEYMERSNESAQNNLKNNFRKFENNFLTNLRHDLFDFVSDNLVPNFTPKTLFGYAERLDRQMENINESKPILNQILEELKKSDHTPKAEWYKIFPDQEIDGFKFKVLTSYAELLKESSEMGNCVVSFDSRCRAGVCHMVSGISPTGERFSIRFNGDNRTLSMYEVNGLSNKGVSRDVTDAVDVLCQKILKQEIPLSRSLGSISKNYTIEQALGFDPFDKDSANAVFQAYQKAEVLPKEMKFVVKALKDFLHQRIEKDVQALRDPSAIAENPSAAELVHGHRDLIKLD